MHRLRVHRRREGREGHLKAFRVHQEGPVILETFISFDYEFVIALLFDTVGDIVLGLLLLAKFDNELIELRAELLTDVLFNRHLTLL